MKVILTKEVELRDVDVNISLDLKKETFEITLSYTCQECAGHGCRRDNGCNNGTISMKLDPAKMDRNLDKETADHLRETVRSLAAAIK
jgi:hypothetical protein